MSSEETPPRFPTTPRDVNNAPVIPILPCGSTISVRGKAYKIVDWEGCGAFGQVYKVVCETTGTFHALKIERKHPSHASLKHESDIYSYMQRNFSPMGLNHIAKVEGYIENNQFGIMIMELCHQSLYSAIKNDTDFHGFPLKKCQGFLREILRVIIDMESCGVIHADLKPENIMIGNSGRIRVVDFGGAVLSTDKLSTYFMSRFYRAPEVILQANNLQGIDIWSLGCIMAELYLGLPIFAGDDNLHMLQLMSIRLDKLTPFGIAWRDYMMPDGSVFAAGPVIDMVGHGRSLKVLLARQARKHKDQPQHIERFYSLLKSMLAFNPENRATPAEIRDHPFLSIVF